MIHTRRNFCLAPIAALLAQTAISRLAAAQPSRPPNQSVTPRPALARATFAGGCFWCMQPPFEDLDGVASTVAGYSGGAEINPTYEQVGSGRTGHAEAVQVTFDPSRIAYARLLDVFWHNIDPLDAAGQFCDRGRQYRTAIFYHDEDQHRAAEQSRSELQASGRFRQPIATEIVAFTAFYPAEEYHQDYHRKNPLQYRFYRFGCGRDQRLRQVWST